MPKKPPIWILIVGIIVAVAALSVLNNALNPSAQPAQEHVHEEGDGHDHDHEGEGEPSEATSAEEPVEHKINAANPVAVVETGKGTIRMRLFADEMPVSTKNFIGLAEDGFYDGLTFHRVEDWVVQGGDPQGTGTGGSKSTIKLEINKDRSWSEKKGYVGMARSQSPDSASSQWFITTQPAQWLDAGVQGEGYALFGEVIEGMEVVEQLKVGDKMQKVTIEKGQDGSSAAPASDVG